MAEKIDYTNRKFGNVTVVSFAESVWVDDKKDGKRKKNYWLCRCDCGFEFKRLAGALKDSQTCKPCYIKSITITDKQVPTRKNKRQNIGVYRISTIWARMKYRCYNPKSNVYSYYGGRGITICDEWLNNYKSFELWALENGYADNLSIDRKENNIGYEPSNCKWSTRIEQQSNLRTNKRYEHNGEMLTAPEIGRIYNIDISKIYARLHMGKTVEQAISMG